MQLKVFHIRLSREHIQQDQDQLNAFLETVTVKKSATHLITGNVNYWSILVFYEPGKSEGSGRSGSKFAIEAESELTAAELELFGILKQWRQDKSGALNVPTYLICHNTELMSIAKLKPQSLQELAQVKGFGDMKISKFGEEILAVLSAV